MEPKNEYAPAEIADIVANAWKTLDASGMRQILADDYEYTSQWVLDTMHGADKYVEYLSQKFEAMKKGGRPTVVAARSNEYHVEIDLKQTINGREQTGMLQFRLRNGKIASGCMCAPFFRVIE